MARWAPGAEFFGRTRRLSPDRRYSIRDPTLSSAPQPNLKSNALRSFGEISRSWVHRKLLPHLALKGQIRYKPPTLHKSHIFGVLLAMKQPIAKNSAGFLGTRQITKVKRSNGVGASLHIELFGGRQSPRHRPLRELFDRIGDSVSRKLSAATLLYIADLHDNMMACCILGHSRGK